MIENCFFKAADERKLFFQNVLGKDIFTLKENDVKDVYKEIMRRYWSEYNVTVIDPESEEVKLEIAELGRAELANRVQWNDIIKTTTIEAVVTGTEGSTLKAKIGRGSSEEADIEVKKCPQLLPGIPWRIKATTRGMEIVKSDKFLLDILCEALYSKKKELKKYCVLTDGKQDDFEDRDLQISFEEFRRNGRKKVEKKGKIETFKDLGYAFPLDAKLKIETAKKTEIEDIVPNIFRFFIMCTEFRKLYEENRGITSFEIENIKKIRETCNLRFDVIEIYKLEDILGVNLAIILTNVLLPIFEGGLQKDIKCKFHEEIKEIVNVIMSFPGAYSRIELAKVITEIYFPENMHEKKSKLIYIQKIMREMVDSMRYEYVFMSEVMKVFTYTELKDWGKELLTENGLEKDKAFGIVEDIKKINIDSQNPIKAYLYSAIQKEITQYYISHEKLPTFC